MTNPANGEQLATIPLSTSNEVDEAVVAAKQAQKSWALVPAPKRAEFFICHRSKKMKEKKGIFGDRFNKRDGEGN
ncbi:aldehyde dehydrogenase family protein [Lysinibacillus sp. MHQ-1]|nr:aldehyde dehydrogenase family protein [Lysinibacillus sp. MHQ-1]